MNTKLHAVTDTSGRPIQFFITAGQVSDYTGAAALLSSLPDAEWLLADRGYDADWFREALIDIGITPCIPGRKSRSKTIKKIGDASQPVMTGAQRSSCQLSLLLQPSYSGYESGA